MLMLTEIMNFTENDLSQIVHASRLTDRYPKHAEYWMY